MLLLRILSPALVGLSAVTASPTVPRASSGSVWDILPNVVETTLNLGRQMAQWTLKTPESDRLPHPPHRPPVFVKKTIYQFLSDEPHFSKIFKLVNLNNATIDLLNGTESNITFFAPPDSAFRAPPKRRHPPDVFPMDSRDVLLEPQPEDPSESVLREILDELDSLDMAYDDNDKKERRRKIIKYIVGAVLSYHAIPELLDIVGLSQNSTYATNLTLPEGSLNGQPLRVRVGRAYFSPDLSVNFFSRLTGPEIVTSNGIVHTVSVPLLPPPAIFTGQFNVPSSFSYATSALQRVGLADEVDYTYVPPHGDEKGRAVGAGTATFFAPSNRAFARLPIRLRLFLFSPFGQRALKKLLQYHIVPSHALHSDYVHNATSSSSLFELSEVLAILPERHIDLGPSMEPVMHSLSRGSHRVQMNVGSAYAPRPLEDHSSPAPIHAENAPRTRRIFPPRPVVEYNVTLVVPTLLENRTHTIVATKYAQPKGIPGLPHPPVPGSSRTQLTVSGSRVSLADVPARNGAFHVVDRLLNPLRDHKHDHREFSNEWERDMFEDEMNEKAWEDWEDWLPKWADEV